MKNQNTLIHARPIPAGAVGPGTQPDEVDGAELDYLSMPGEMARPIASPLLPEPEEVAGLAEAMWLLRALQHLLGGYCIGALPQVDRPARPGCGQPTPGRGQPR